MMSVRETGNTWVAAGCNIKAFGETKEQALQRFEQLKAWDERQHRDGKPH